MKELFSRPWIERVWTYQEFFLASNPTIACGKFHIEWTALEQYLQLFSGLPDIEDISAAWVRAANSKEQLSAVSPNTRTIQLPSWKTLKYPPWNFLRVYGFLVEYSAAGAAITAFDILGVACVLFYFNGLCSVV
jgi:hypothetical protein